MPRRFTLAEAQSLIPQVETSLQSAILAKAQYEKSERDLQEFSERIMMMGGITVDRQRAVDARNRRENEAAELRNAIEAVQELGCVVKDLDIGLVDFPTTFHGVEVYLCWKLCESKIGWWHGTDEGFRGRKAIDQDFLDNHHGDLPH